MHVLRSRLCPVGNPLGQRKDPTYRWCRQWTHPNTRRHGKPSTLRPLKGQKQAPGVRARRAAPKAEASADREPPLTEQEQRMIEKNAAELTPILGAALAAGSEVKMIRPFEGQKQAPEVLARTDVIASPDLPTYIVFPSSEQDNLWFQEHAAQLEQQDFPHS
ncbi:hypothetical protein CVIRNUC_002600 [Coccomyxa viridis]|uniref:Uncharacterized protein n=1 Tax=Coccomyxa viridis TaxID=1274662 RepID=A0AAV1I0P6_9CHLO|nr:hypothetical protein CVIRNUC_002600 [Coccomyxa viridis]